MVNAVISKTACPKCRKSGADSTGDNLVNYADGGSHCFACGYHVSSAYSKEVDKGTVPAPSMPMNIIEVPMLKGGLITGVTTLQYEVFQLEDKGEGTGVAVYPYHDLDGNLTGVKYRDYASELKTGKKKIWWHGVPYSFFGIKAASSLSDVVVICEGESDTMAMRQVFPHYTVVGISGGDHATKAIKNASVWLRTRFKNIYICFDNDKAGKEATETAVSLLPKWRTYVMSLPPKVKDVCEATAIQIKKAFAGAMPVLGSDIVTGNTLMDDFYKWKAGTHDTGGVSTGFNFLDKMLGGGGLQKGEMLVLVAHTGRGKSTFCTDIAYNMINDGTKCLWIGTEMLPNQMLIKFIERHTGTAYRNKEGKICILPDDEKRALEFITKSMCFYNNLYGDSGKVLEACVNAIMVHDVEVIFIDVLQDIDEEFGGKYQAAASIMKKLMNLCQGNPDERQPAVSLVCVQHTITRDGKESAEVSLGEIRGGGAVKQIASCIIALNGIPTENIRYLKLLKKSRMLDSDVTSAMVEYSKETKTYYEIEE